MPKRSANLHAHRPAPPTQPHAWAILVTPNGTRRLHYMPACDIVTDAERATTRLLAGWPVFCGRGIWDAVYAWWEQKQSCPGTHTPEQLHVCVISANINQPGKDSTNV